MKKVVGLVLLVLHLHFNLFAQVDTAYVYKTGLPYGTLDIRIAKSATRYYYLQKNKTVSFRESAPGVKTNTYRDMTAWDSSPYGEGNLREKNGSADAFIMNYRLLEPLNYNANYDPGYPLIVFMHGAGERGNCWQGTCYFADGSWNPNTNSPAAPTTEDLKLLNNDHNLLHGGSVHLNMRNAANGKLPNDPTLSARSFPGFVLFPQNLNGWTSTSVQDAIKLVRLVAKQYNIDENRIYIEGLSNGGYGTYEAIKRAPWLFAAAFTMSAVSDASITSQNYQAKIATIPIWTFQGGQDTDPTPAKTQGYVKKFKDAGLDVRFTLYPDLGHGTWNTAMNEGDYFKYMLQQNKANIHTFASSKSICTTTGEGLKMEVAEGFRAYQWEKNGVVISGANTYTYTATTTGTYRARFSRVANPTASDWNQWSQPITVTTNSPAKPDIDQIGTIILKDLNGFGDAKLKAVGQFDKYFWYKNGTKLAFNDTVSMPTIKATSGNGAYTLVTSGFDGCLSPASDAKQIFFNNTATVTITAPTNFAGTTPNAGKVNLTWASTSSNESGFEIWRRKLVSGTTYTKWEMRTLTNANATSYVDNGAEPSSTYQYKIRAVGTSGRSDYTPAASNAYLVINTGGDSQAPSIPQALTATATGINTIKLSWQASTDNSGIRQYRIYYGSQSVLTNSTSTTYTLTGLTLNTVYNFTVKAEDVGGNLSGASNTATANTYVTGLYYEHSTGAWTDLDAIDWNAHPEFTGKVTTFTLSPRTQEDFFNFEFFGYLYINIPGAYRLQTLSSDGSRLELDGTVIVNNDGIHNSRTITSAWVTLDAGPHAINVKYFEYDESQSLTVKYQGPDTENSFVSIPASALKSGNAPSGARMATASEPEIAAMEEPASKVNIYPNPTSPSDINVQMEFKREQAAPVQIRLIDFTGKEVYQGEFNADEVNYGVKLQPGQTMRDGIYLMQVYQNGKVTQHRISIKN
jgi:hypothetical protein